MVINNSFLAGTLTIRDAQDESGPTLSNAKSPTFEALERLVTNHDSDVSRVSRRAVKLCTLSLNCMYVINSGCEHRKCCSRES